MAKALVLLLVCLVCMLSSETAWAKRISLHRAILLKPAEFVLAASSNFENRNLTLTHPRLALPNALVPGRVGQDAFMETVGYLHCAVAGRNNELIRMLLKKGADIEDRRAVLQLPSVRLEGVAPLGLASILGNVEAVRILMELGADPDTTAGETFFNAMNLAAYFDHPEAVEALADAGVAFETEQAQDPMGSPESPVRVTSMTHPFHSAAVGGATRVLEWFLERGVDIHLRSHGGKGDAVIHGTASHGHLEATKFLVQRGADINMLSGDEVRPVDLAADRGYTEVVEYLMIAGSVEPNDIDKSLSDLNEEGIPKVFVDSTEPDIIDYVADIRKNKKLEEERKQMYERDQKLLELDEERHRRKEAEEQAAEAQALREMAQQDGLDKDDL